MERRLLTFIVASTAFFFVYISLRMMFVPPEKLAPANQAVAELDPNAEDAAAVDSEADPADTPAVAPQDSGDAGDSAAEASDDLPARPTRGEWVTLGSMDPAANYFMLVTLNSRGAGIERIELTERTKPTKRYPEGKLKYRRVDTYSGYLGYFAGEPTTTIDGVRVNVVGPGTPAAMATGDDGSTGIKVDDVIIAIGGTLVASEREIRDALAKSKPGQEVTVEVVRGAVSGDDESGPGSEINFKATLSEHPLDLIRLAKTGGDDQVAGNLNRLSSLLTLGKVNRKNIPKGEQSIGGLVDPAGMIWDVSEQPEDATSVNFTVGLSDTEMKAVGGEAVALTRSYALAPETYIIDTSIKIDNQGETEQQLAYRLEGFNGVTLEGWWYSNKISPNWGGSAARDVIYKTGSEGHELISGYTLLKKARNTPEDADQNIFAEDQSEQARNLSYIGVDAQYFDVAYIPPGTDASMTSFRRATANIIADPALIQKHKDRAVNTSFYLDSNVQSVAPGASIRQDLRIFAGPKEAELLAQHGLSKAAYYGWFWFIAQPLGELLHWLYWLVGNYAVAIILLTVLVRGAMFPLSRKAAVNAQRMQELAPELKKIGEKYKDDMEGRLKAQRALQQRVGFNPMAGCLPMFMQLPIFVGLYRSLSVDIELRQAAVSPSMNWASNLASPDQMLYWGDWMWGYMSGRGNGWLGPYFNILPLVVMVLFLLQQKMFMPPATDEQTAMTQKMMSWMTLVMGLFFFRVPAGLCLYFVTSSLWGICERIIVKKTLPAGKHFDAAALATADGAPVEATNSKSLAERIRDRVAQPEPTIERPSKRKRPGGGKKKK